MATLVSRSRSSLRSSLSGRESYHGQTKKQLREGHGVYAYENKFFRYEGEWKDGKKHGHGKLVMKDGSYYEGQFESGEISGRGYRYFAPNRSRYTGQFLHGELHGKGKMEYHNGAIYEGDWDRNRKHGTGVMRNTDDTMYEGGYHENKRHGGGTMVYVNGDRYDGEWLHDKRHGHGTLRLADGSIYEGQFMDDMFYGQGIMYHCSGMVHEGLWTGGLPSKMAAKIVIVVETSTTPFDIRQGISFDIRVECRDENDEIVNEDQGRLLQIIAGFKYQKPKQGSALFDMIEDVEDKPIQTPFGYEVVPYPLTDQLGQVEIKDDGDEDDTSTIRPGELKEEEEDKEDASSTKDNLDGELKEEVPSGETTGADDNIPESEALSPSSVQENTVAGAINEDSQTQDNSAEKETTPLPPPVSSQRSTHGCCNWSNLQLAPPPPMYRPFVVMAEAEGGPKKSKSRMSTVPKPGEGRESRAGKLKKEKDAKQASSSEETVARVGEYVLMVHDITNPPFLGKTLDPAFLLMKLRRPKRERVKKEPKPKWDTQRHIAMSMTRT